MLRSKILDRSSHQREILQAKAKGTKTLKHNQQDQS
jgi:hypothetical protein